MAYRTVKTASETEYTVNKSRFIGRCIPVETEEEALSELAAIRKKHWDATHNCYAYVIGKAGADAASTVMRFSDDGEPGGTAGMPMLNVLRQKGITNVLVVSTRYFGGILLGAGGLVRAYSKSAAMAVDASGIVSVVDGVIIKIAMDYSRYGSLDTFLQRKKAEPESLMDIRGTVFTDLVTVEVGIRAEEAERFIADIVELTDGRVTPEITARCELKI